MLKQLKKPMLVALVVLVATFFQACQNMDDVSEITPTLTPTSAPSMKLPSQTSYSAVGGADGGVSWSIAYKQEGSVGVGVVTFYGEDSDKVNTAVNAAIAQVVKDVIDSGEENIYTEFSVNLNARGIISALIYAKNIEDDEPLLIVPFNYNVVKGEYFSIKDVLNSESERWRGLIPDIIIAEAAQNGITLLNDVMPINNDQAFYLTEDGIVILYRPYEIAAAAKLWPEFLISYTAFSEYITVNSPVYALTNLN